MKLYRNGDRCRMFLESSQKRNSCKTEVFFRESGIKVAKDIIWPPSRFPVILPRAILYIGTDGRPFITSIHTRTYKGWSTGVFRLRYRRTLEEKDASGAAYFIPPLRHLRKNDMKMVEVIISLKLGGHLELGNDEVSFLFRNDETLVYLEVNDLRKKEILDFYSNLAHLE